MRPVPLGGLVAQEGAWDSQQAYYRAQKYQLDVNPDI